MTLIKKTAVVIAGVLLALSTLVVIAAPTAEAAPWECPVGSFEDSAGNCRQPVADAVACPKDALGVPFACYVFVDHVPNRVGEKVCPTGSFQDGNGECRKPVANAAVCPKGALGVPGACYVYVPKVSSKMLHFG